MLWSAYLEKEDGNEAKFNQLMANLTQLKKLVDSGQATAYPKGKIEYFLAIYAILQDKNSDAISHLQNAYKAGNKEYYWWRNFTPFFQDLEGYPEYQDLMSEMKADIDRMRENYLQSQSS